MEPPGSGLPMPYNAVSHKDAYPLPRIEDILSTLGEAKYFSTLDLATQYWQMIWTSH